MLTDSRFQHIQTQNVMWLFAWKPFTVCKPKHQLQPRLVYQACSKTFLHMLEFSWCRGNSEPGTSWSLLLFEENVCPEGSFSCLDTVSLEHTRCKNRLVLFIWHIFLNSITHSLALKSDWWIPEGESGFVHLHADEEGVLRELHRWSWSPGWPLSQNLLPLQRLRSLYPLSHYRWRPTLPCTQWQGWA